MSDLISRKALIEKVRLQHQDALHGAEVTGQTRFKQKATDCKNFIDLIESESSVTDTNAGCKWIPCSKRLPEENKDGWTNLILSIKTGEVIFGFWHNEETGFCKHFRDGICSVGGVIAWMPLPQPYAEHNGVMTE